jgi:hypothetical protein
LEESFMSMMTTCAVSPTFSRTQMNLSDSMVRVLNPMLAALMPTFWSWNENTQTFSCEHKPLRQKKSEFNKCSYTRCLPCRGIELRSLACQQFALATRINPSLNNNKSYHCRQNNGSDSSICCPIIAI